MKAAVIICIISLSLSLSEAAEPLPPRDVSAATVTTAPTTERVDKTIIKVVTTPSPPPAPQKTPDVSTPGTQADEKKTETKPEVKTPEDKKEIDHKPEDNKTDGKKTESVEKPTVKPEETTVLTNPTKPAGGKDEPTTPHAATEKTTEAPKQPASEAPVLVAGRGFDGPSFIGGIVLTLGLLAIGFMGFKYYKNQTERNYHTL